MIRMVMMMTPSGCAPVFGVLLGELFPMQTKVSGKTIQFTINVIGRWGYDNNIMISGAGDYNCCEFTLGRLFCNFKALLFGWQHHWQVALVVVYITYMRAIIKMLRRYGWRFLAMIVIKCDSFGIINLYLQYLCCSSYISWGFCC